MRLCNDVETNPGPGSKSPTKQRRGGGRQRGRGGPGGGSRGPSNYNTEDESDSNRSFDRRGSTLESRHEQLAEKVDGLKEQVSYNFFISFGYVMHPISTKLGALSKRECYSVGIAYIYISPILESLKKRTQVFL